MFTRIMGGSSSPVNRVGEELAGGAARSWSMAAVPLTMVGRSVWGAGRRLAGTSADLVQAEIAEQTMNQLFSVLGRLKGGATKVSQNLALFEAALPEPWAGACRKAMAELDQAPPAMPATVMHRALAEALGDGWRERFRTFDDAPAAAASIGQVHRGVWHDGRAVAVKVQYPGAAEALRSDLKTLAHLAGTMGLLMPGLDVKPLVAELKERLGEELDYTAEAEAQRRFADAYRGHPDIAVPEVVFGSATVIVSEWLDGTPLAVVVEGDDQDLKDQLGYALSLLQFSAPVLCGLLHADPHPGNFLALDDGRLGVLDFGAVARFPDGIPSSVWSFVDIVLDGDQAAAAEAMVADGFVRPGASVDVARVLAFLRPVVEPLGRPEFTFSRRWLRRHVAAGGNPLDAVRTLRGLNLPPEYLLMHRASLATLALLCRLEATAPYGDLAATWALAADSEGDAV